MIESAQDLLAYLLVEGPLKIGEIIVAPVGGGYHLFHHDNQEFLTFFKRVEDRDHLERQRYLENETVSPISAASINSIRFYDRPEAARQIARYTEEGEYRPLKSAPTLRSAWLLQLVSLEEVVLALEFFYPAALNLYLTFLKNQLQTTSLRETLDRQTGMYRITQLLQEGEAEDLTKQVCDSSSGCLRTIMWHLGKGKKEESWSDQPMQSLPEQKQELAAKLPSKEAGALPTIPLICREACNLLIAKARPLARKNLPAQKK